MDLSQAEAAATLAGALVSTDSVLSGGAAALAAVEWECSVAVKVVDRTRLRPHDEEALAREVACLRALAGHPGCLALRAARASPRRHYLVTELLGGGDLFDRVVVRGRYPEPAARAVARQLARTLAHVHASGLVHRDLKPENVLLESYADDVTVTPPPRPRPRRRSMRRVEQERTAVACAKRPLESAPESTPGSERHPPPPPFFWWENSQN